MVAYVEKPVDSSDDNKQSTHCLSSVDLNILADTNKKDARDMRQRPQVSYHLVATRLIAWWMARSDPTLPGFVISYNFITSLLASIRFCHALRANT